MVASRIALALTSVLIFAGSAAVGQDAQASHQDSQAAEMVVATSRAAPVPAAAEAPKAKTATAKPLGDPAQMVAWLNTAAPTADIARAAPASPPVTETKSNPLNIHGSAGVSVGTGGYRSAYASAIIPVGDNGMLGIAVGHTDFGTSGLGYVRPGYGYGNGYGYGYGYGYGADNVYRSGYGRGRRGGSMDSLAVSYEMDDGAGSADAPEGCAPGFRAGDRYVEPVWASRLHGDTPCDPRLGEE